MWNRLRVAAYFTICDKSLELMEGSALFWWYILIRSLGIVSCWRTFNTVFFYTRGAGKSLARPTSRCRSAESIVSLERGVCSCAELQVFSSYRGWKEACQATRAISNIETRTSIFRPTQRSLLPWSLVGRANFWIFFEWLAKVRATG